MYRGSRASVALKYAGDEPAVRKNALAALQKYMNYTADKMSMSELRMVLRKRWYNDASVVDPEIAKPKLGRGHWCY